MKKVLIFFGILIPFLEYLNTNILLLERVVLINLLFLFIIFCFFLFIIISIKEKIFIKKIFTRCRFNIYCSF